MNKSLLLKIGVVPFLFLTACVMPPEQPVAPSTAATMVPQIVAMPETKEAQEKGGVEIMLASQLYKPEQVESSTEREVPIDLTDITRPAPPGVGSERRVIAKTTTTALKTAPDRVQFTVTINNKLSRVFRGQGAVVQFNIGGKLVNVDQGRYASLNGAIIPPRNSASFVIDGPDLSTMPPKATIGIFIYDVITGIDVAGNVTEKQNFEWYYDYAAKQVEQQVPGPRVERRWANKS